MRLILGGPGTGKTTRLLSIMSEQIDRGVSPDRIAFVSFTKKAAREARERAIDRFGLTHDDLPFFRTMHSLAYSLTGCKRGDVIGDNNLKEFGELAGVEFSRYQTDGLVASGTDGDKALHIMSFANATCIPLADAWHETGESIEWHTLEYIAESYRHYKIDTSKLDFNDMLDRYIRNCSAIDADVVIIDEAQDMSTHLWQVASHMFSGVSDKIVAGDDMQSIFRWAGADVNRFLHLTDTPEVLPVSYRLPREVFDLANDIARRVEHKYEKHWRPSDNEGGVIRATYYDDFDLTEGTWMMLARNSCFLNDFKERVHGAGYAYATKAGSSVDEEEVAAIHAYERLRGGGEIDLNKLRLINDYLGINRIKEIPVEERLYSAQDVADDHGFPIHETPWFDALVTIGDEQRQYYQSILANGAKLTEEPRIYIGTIHSVKGGEADNVVLSTDFTYRTRCGYDMAPDDEHRVFYTGATRTRHNLYVLDPTTAESYPML